MHLAGLLLGSEIYTTRVYHRASAVEIITDQSSIIQQVTPQTNPFVTLEHKSISYEHSDKPGSFGVKRVEVSCILGELPRTCTQNSSATRVSSI